MVFTDNAGVDFILGVLPFARELLKRNTKVVICSNSGPAVNDVTFKDLPRYLDKAARHCKVLERALNEKHLIFAENGQKGPALDLRYLPAGLPNQSEHGSEVHFAKLLETCRLIEAADLVIIVGVGRSILTNFDAKFKVDCIKVCVLKVAYLAKQLKAQPMDAIFKYEAAT